MPGDKKSIENDYNPKPGDMQQGQNGQQGAKTDQHQPMDSKQNDEKQHSRRNGKPPPPDDMQQGHNSLQGEKSDPHQPTDPTEDKSPMAPLPSLSDGSGEFALK